MVGGGPAGAVAAYHLARNGARVALLEKERLPRYKTCGGGVVARARRLLPIGIDHLVERECRVVEMRLSDTGVRFRVERRQPIVAMTMRATLDKALVDAACQAGSALFAPCRVQGVSALRDGVVLGTSRGSMRARFVIAADGVASPIARAAGWRTPLRGIPALEWELWLAPGTSRSPARHAEFDCGFIQDGYAWSFPKRAHVSVGIVSANRGRAGLRADLGRYLEQRGIGAVRGVERHGFTIPTTPRADGFLRHRVMLAGDAAGLVDPVSCEGISYAALSGKLAALTLLEERFDEARVKSGYESALRTRGLADLAVARKLARLLYRPSRARNALLRRYGQRLCELLTEAMIGNTSYRQLAWTLLKARA